MLNIEYNTLQVLFKGVCLRYTITKGSKMKISTLEKHTNEAALVGLTLLGASSRGGGYKFYRFDSCSHVADLKTGNVRNKKIKCNVCLVKKLIEEGEAVGLTLLGASSKGKDYRRYRFNNCNHEAEIQKSAVRINSFTCSVCFAENHTNEAALFGLTLLGASSRGCHYRRYRFNCCSHVDDLQTSAVRINNFTCSVCIAEKHTNEADEVGLTLLGASSKGCYYRRYRFNCCSHVDDLQTSAVRNNSFTCNTCEETSRTQPSSTYLLKITVGEVSWLKYGYAKEVSTRMKGYGLPEAAVVKLLAKECFATGNEAHAYESSIHAQLGKHKLSATKMKKYHTKNGQTECYPIHMLEKLVKTF